MRALAFAIVAPLAVLPASAHAAPTAFFDSYVEGVNGQYQHAVADQMWINPGMSGSFELRIGATDPVEGIERVDFPNLGSGWTPAGTSDSTPPYATTYSWSAGAVAPGAMAAVAWSNIAETATAPFAVAADSTPPAGATITAQSTITRDTSVPVSGTTGTDTQSGIGSWRYQRRAAALAADACGAFGAWTDISTASPAGPISDQSLPDASCLQYRLVVEDNVGNESVATQDGELRVDRSAPAIAIDPIPAGLYGTVTLTGTASDSTTRVRSVAIMLEDRYSICPSAPLVDGRWTCSWTIGPGETGAASISAAATDAAGQRAAVATAVTMVAPPSPLGPREEDVDRQPPVVGLARMPLISWNGVVKVKASGFDDRPGTLELRVEQQSRSARAARFTPWAPSFEESELVPLEDRGDTSCFRGVAVDEAGNESTSDARCTTVPLDDADFVARGRWDRLNVRAAYDRGLRRTTRRGSSLTITMADATPTLVVTACRGCGTIRVYHGRRIVGTYSLAAPRTINRRLINLRALVRPASQPLRIVAMTNRPVLIDGLVANH